MDRGGLVRGLWLDGQEIHVLRGDRRPAATLEVSAPFHKQRCVKLLSPPGRAGVAPDPVDEQNDARHDERIVIAVNQRAGTAHRATPHGTSGVATVDSRWRPSAKRPRQACETVTQPPNLPTRKPLSARCSSGSATWARDRIDVVNECQPSIAPRAARTERGQKSKPSENSTSSDRFPQLIVRTPADGLAHGPEGIVILKDDGRRALPDVGQCMSQPARTPGYAMTASLRRRTAALSKPSGNLVNVATRTQHSDTSDQRTRVTYRR